MAKLIRSYRISQELDTLLKAESSRLSEETGKKVSEADVIEIALVAWLGGNTAEAGVNTNLDECNTNDRHAAAESALQEAETAHPKQAEPPKRAESVAQRRAREAKEHAEKLADSDVIARMTGRDDIEYDLENVPHQSALHVALQKPAPVKHHYEVEKRKVKPLTRPHG